MSKIVHEEVLMCGYKKCCPTVRILEDGSVELTDDDAINGSVGTIKMKPESAARLVELLLTTKP
jgi:hypothetical protein